MVPGMVFAITQENEPQGICLLFVLRKLGLHHCRNSTKCTYRDYHIPGKGMQEEKRITRASTVHSRAAHMQMSGKLFDSQNNSAQLLLRNLPSTAE